MIPLSNNHIKLAQENGITPKEINDRLRRGWTAQRAVTFPVDRRKGRKKTKRYLHAVEVAKRKGIPMRTFYARLKHGWTLKDASSIPIQAPGQFHKPVESWGRIAVRNGINYATYRARVYTYGWAKERAATQPVKRKDGSNVPN